MQLWLLIVRKLPVSEDLKMIEHKLLEWKKSKTRDSIMLVNLYLSIFYFITLCEGEGAASPQIATKLDTANKIVQEEGKQNKSRSRIIEWLQAKGKGFQCLCSDQQVPTKMRELEGKANISTRNPSLSWKGIHVHFNPTYASSEMFSDGQLVKFNVGFSLRGICAIKVESVQVQE